MGDTQIMSADMQVETLILPEKAYLVIEGIKVLPIRKKIVNIGRRVENDIVLDDPRVSRKHAQLRQINGHFILFDLQSRGGTYVNGTKTDQTILYPGDIISLAGYTLVFGQGDPPARPDLKETAPF